jgi:hypothetical protein
MLLSSQSPMPPTTTDSDAAALYVQHFEMLKDIATSQFHLAPDDAEALAGDVLIASLRHSRSTEWLTGAMIYAIRSHLGAAR